MSTWRVSQIESFRQWENDQDSDLDDLLSRLRWDSPPSEAMLAGIAFHKALELAPTGLSANSISANGYTFAFDDDFEIELPATRELRMSKVYTVDGAPITISGQVDAIEGNRIDDHKTTSYFNPDRYLNGYQWRIYLDIFGASRFRWNVFEIKETAPKLYGVYDAHRLEQFRYCGLEDDCHALVTRFARFVREYIR